jgi:hypothetical protein
MKLTIKELKSMSPEQVLEDDRVRERVISLYSKLHGVEREEAELFYNREEHNFSVILSDKEKYKNPSGFSIYGIMVDLAAMGLTLEMKSRALVYIEPNGSVNAGTDKAPDWKTNLKLEISPYGELDLRIKAGQLLYADNPVIVYEGDSFEPLINERGEKAVLYRGCIPRKSNEIIASFVKLVRPDGSFDYHWLAQEDIQRLAAYSGRRNKGKVNHLYTSQNGGIDAGFLMAKTIKHSFKTFPKLKLGQFSTLSSEQAVDYGLDEEVVNQVEEIDELQEETQETQETQGITINNPDEPF